jgi:hypothetical protein
MEEEEIEEKLEQKHTGKEWIPIELPLNLDTLNGLIPHHRTILWIMLLKCTSLDWSSTSALNSHLHQVPHFNTKKTSLSWWIIGTHTTILALLMKFQDSVKIFYFTMTRKVKCLGMLKVASILLYLCFCLDGFRESCLLSAPRESLIL